MSTFNDIKVINKGKGLADGTLNVIRPILTDPTLTGTSKTRKQVKEFELAVESVKEFLLRLKTLNNDPRYDEPLLLLEKTIYKKEIKKLIHKDKDRAVNAVVLISDRFRTVFQASQKGDAKHKQDMVSLVEFLLIEQLDPALIDLQKSTSVDSIFLVRALNVYSIYLINRFRANGVIVENYDPKISSTSGLSQELPIVSLDSDQKEIESLKFGQSITINTKEGTIDFDGQTNNQANNLMICPSPVNSNDLSPVNVSTYLSNVTKPIENGTDLIVNTNKLFLEQAPTAYQQSKAYEKVIKLNKDNNVSFILFNVDTLNKPKWLDYGNYVSDLLVKGIRLAYVDQKIFADQIKAIIQAAALTDKEVTILLPMVSTTEEYLVLQNAVKSIKADLVKKGKKAGNVNTSVIIETPSLAMDLEIVLRNNDKVVLDLDEITQYLMGIEKNNQLFNHLYQPLNPVILKFVQQILIQAKTFNTNVYIQGRSVNEPEVLLALVGLGAKHIVVSRYFTDEAKLLTKKYNNQEVINLVESVKNYKVADDVEHDIEIFIEQHATLYN